MKAVYKKQEPHQAGYSGMKVVCGMCQWGPTVVSALQYHFKAVVWLQPFIYHFHSAISCSVQIRPKSAFDNYKEMDYML